MHRLCGEAAGLSAGAVLQAVVFVFINLIIQRGIIPIFDVENGNYMFIVLLGCSGYMEIKRLFLSRYR
jgi:hypothetical protein